MQDSTYIFLSIPIFAAISLMAACDNCGKDKPPTPPPGPTTTVTAPESSTVTPPPPPAPTTPPEPAWAPVMDLKAVQGHWGDQDGDGAWVELQPRAKEGLLYPWYLEFSSDKDAPYDCGVFEKPHEPDSWRVAYCKGGDITGERQADRLLLSSRGDELIVTLSSGYTLHVVGRSK